MVTAPSCLARAWKVSTSVCQRSILSESIRKPILMGSETDEDAAGAGVCACRSAAENRQTRIKASLRAETKGPAIKPPENCVGPNVAGPGRREPGFER